MLKINHIRTFCQTKLSMYVLPFDRQRYLKNATIYIPDSLTCRPDVGRRSALVGHIGRYGRHQADVGSISGQIGHICRYGRHLADIEPTCKHGVGPISADMRRYRPDIISDIRPISRPTFPDIGPTSGRSVCAIWVVVSRRRLRAACGVVNSLRHGNAEYRGTSRELGYNGSAQYRPQVSFQNEL